MGGVDAGGEGFVVEEEEGWLVPYKVIDNRKPCPGNDGQLCKGAAMTIEQIMIHLTAVCWRNK